MSVVRQGAEIQLLCVKCRSTYENVVIARKSSSCEVAETTGTQRREKNAREDQTPAREGP